MDRLDVQASREDLRTVFVENLRQIFEEDTTNALPAFQALTSIAAYWWSEDENPPDQVVEVPWWALETVCAGYMLYMDAAKEGRTTTFGQAYGLEAHGQGKPRRVQGFLKSKGDREVALAVAIELESLTSVEKAVAKVSEQCRRSESSVWRIWREHGRKAQLCLSNYRTLKTS